MEGSEAYQLNGVERAEIRWRHYERAFLKCLVIPMQLLVEWVLTSLSARNANS